MYIRKRTYNRLHDYAIEMAESGDKKSQRLLADLQRYRLEEGGSTAAQKPYLVAIELRNQRSNFDKVKSRLDAMGRAVSYTILDNRLILAFVASQNTATGLAAELDSMLSIVHRSIVIGMTGDVDNRDNNELIAWLRNNTDLDDPF